jgi:hypothetical protein
MSRSRKKKPGGGMAVTDSDYLRGKNGPMKCLAACLVALLALFAFSPADAAYRIAYDPGGELQSFIAKFDALRLAGAHVIIDGECISACTLVTSLPPSKVCITPRAELAFHSAFVLDDDGSKHFSPDGTSIIWHEYPKVIRDMLTAKGWDRTQPQENMIWLDHDDLAAIYPDCSAKRLAG